jgi:hypothetical protein
MHTRKIDLSGTDIFREIVNEAVDGIHHLRKGEIDNEWSADSQFWGRLHRHQSINSTGYKPSLCIDLATRMAKIRG